MCVRERERERERGETRRQERQNELFITSNNNTYIHENSVHVTKHSVKEKRSLYLFDNRQPGQLM